MTSSATTPRYTGCPASSSTAAEPLLGRAGVLEKVTASLVREDSECPALVEQDADLARTGRRPGGARTWR